MRGRHWFALVLILALALALPVTAWFTGEARALQALKQTQLAELQREHERQQRAQDQFTQRERLVAQVNDFVAEVEGYGLSSRGIGSYPVRFRERVAPEAVTAELMQLQGEPDRFYQPHSFFFGREGLDLSNRHARRLDTLSRVRNDRYVLTYQGRALVVNDDG